MGYRFSKPAEQDIIDIYLQSEEMFGASQADRYLTGLYETLDFLAENPKAARERTELVRSVRVHPYKAHVILYRIDGEDISYCDCVTAMRIGSRRPRATEGLEELSRMPQRNPGSPRLRRTTTRASRRAALGRGSDRAPGPMCFFQALSSL